MSDSRRLVYSIIKFLKQELDKRDLSGESAEGVEVGIQCLQAAYNLAESEPALEITQGLEDIFQEYIKENVTNQPALTPEQKVQAEVFKNEGNNYMTNENFSEAIVYYTKAIKLDPTNAVYFCNRAAASNRLGNFENAIPDCKTALKIDPKYCKAYGRLGLAYASLNCQKEAVECYKKALELEPDNESYKANLKLAQDSMPSTTNDINTSVPFQTPDISAIFSNPSLISMASQMLSNPSMQHMMNNILTGNMTQERGGGMDALLQASQQLAQQMENDNPQLVEQLRRQIGGADGSGEGNPETPES